MKITDSINTISSHSVKSGTAGKARTADTASTSTSASPPTGSSTTSIGSSASTSPQLQALQANIAGSSSFNVQKVEAIKQAIAGGQFQVDTGKVASELISSVRSLLQSGGQQA